MAVEKQNVLLPINFVGVLIGVGVGLYTIPRYGLLGGIITQMFIELLFMLGAIRVAKRKKVSPVFPSRNMWKLSLILLGFAII